MPCHHSTFKTKNRNTVKVFVERTVNAERRVTKTKVWAVVNDSVCVPVNSSSPDAAFAAVREANF